MIGIEMLRTDGSSPFCKFGRMKCHRQVTSGIETIALELSGRRTPRSHIQLGDAAQKRRTRVLGASLESGTLSGEMTCGLF